MNFDNLPLIPRQILFDNPDRAALTISPDGQRLMWLAPLDGVLNIWVAPRDDLAAARVLTRNTGRGIYSCFWAHNKDYILSLQDDAGDENWHLHAVELATGDSRDLTPFEVVTVKFNTRSRLFPDEVIVGLNHRNPQWHDIYRINIVTGEMTLLLEHDRFANVIVDNEFQMRIAAEMTDEGGATCYQMIDGDWQHWTEIPSEDMYTTGLLGFDKSNKTLYMQDSRDQNTAAIVEVDLATNEKRLLATDPQVDAVGHMRHPTEKHIQAVSFVYDRKRWQILDPDIEADIEYLHTVADGDFAISSRSRDDQFWTVVYVIDDGPARFYLYDRQKSIANFLFTSQKALENQPLAKMHSMVIEARDGLEMVGYYSLPPGADSKNDGVPDQPLPMVFTPHGGPWYRDVWGCNRWHQWLTNRGYAVLSINFRASTGFGKAFLNAGNLEWGGKIIEDQQDAVEWAIKTGIADPERMAVMGGSFGGYSVLAGLTQTPELFACGVNQVGVVNLETWMETIPEYWKPLLDLLRARVGDPRNEEGRALLKKHSPINYADRICKPLFVAQGANDPRVVTAEPEQIVEAMQDNGVAVTYVLYPDEGHGFMRPQNNRSFYSMVEAFLAKHIGGRYEPIGNDFEGSSAELLVGADLIPGLPETLTASIDN